MTTPIKLYNTLALLAAIALMSLGLARGIVSDLHVPAARILVAQCQGFEALATAGGTRLSCGPDAPVPNDGTTGAEARPAAASGQPAGTAIAHGKV